MFVEHPLLKKDMIEARDYQLNIVKTCLEHNTLCVLGTGLGKTNIAIMVAAHRMQTYPGSKVLIMAPTRPLCAQHQQSFHKFFKDEEVPEDSIILVTGKMLPNKRKKAYKIADIVCATPQTIQNDVKNGIIDLGEFSLLVVDEVHRAVKKYAYPIVAKSYMTQALHPRIIGLTASPGSSKDRIKEICKALGTDAIEIKTEEDEDVKDYVKELNTEWIEVELPDNMKKAQKLIKLYLGESIASLSKYELKISRKGDIIDAQKKVQAQMAKYPNPQLFQVISILAECLKVWHLLEVFETQSIAASRLYLKKLGEQTSKSAKRVMANEKIMEAQSIIEEMHRSGKEHPKMEKIKELVAENLDKKIIIFSQYRDNIDKIKSVLETIDGCKPAILIGQAGEKGLSQKEQISIIRDLEEDIYNVLITTSIGEEGLDIGKLDMAIFYEPVPSEIRTIQRRGRVGRAKVGRAIFLLTLDTRDEAYYWTAHRKEKEMKSILKDMKGQMTLDRFKQDI